jgi:hypothetical protein
MHPQLTELAVIEALEGLADPESEAGEWTAAFDLVEKGTALTLARQPSPGVCGVECRTLAMAVADVLDASDTDLAERLFAATAGRRGVAAPDVSAWLCGAEGSGACVAKPPPLPPTRPAGPAFQPEAPDAAQARRMMAQMRAAGLGGELYDRNSIEDTLAELDAEEEAAEQGKGEGKTTAKKEGAAPVRAPTSGGGGGGVEGMGGVLDEPPAVAAAALEKLSGKAAAGGGGGGRGGGGASAAVDAARGWAASAAARAKAMAGRVVGGGGGGRAEEL